MQTYADVVAEDAVKYIQLRPVRTFSADANKDFYQHIADFEVIEGALRLSTKVRIAYAAVAGVALPASICDEIHERLFPERFLSFNAS